MKNMPVFAQHLACFFKQRSILYYDHVAACGNERLKEAEHAIVRFIGGYKYRNTPVHNK